MHSWRSRLVALVLSMMVAIVACSAKTEPAGGLQLIVATNLLAPTDFDTVRLEVRQEVSPGQWSSPLINKDFLIPGDTTLPTTFAIVAGKSTNQNALIRVVALKGERPLVLREAQIQIPKTRVAALTFVLASSCAGKLKVDATGSAQSACADPLQSCQPDTGECGSTVIDPATLPNYTPGDENSVTVPSAGDAGTADADARTPECVGGAKRCDGNAPQVCDEGGRWRTSPACNHQTCIDGACVGVCAPADRECLPTTSKACNPTGNWTTTDLTVPKWTQTYGTANNEVLQVAPSTLAKMGDGNYLLVGNTAEAGAVGVGAGDGYAVKLSPTGAKLWEKTLGTYLVSATGTTDGAIVCGTAKRGLLGCTANRNCGYCAKLGLDGSIVWQKTYVQANNDLDFYDVVAPGGLPDGGAPATESFVVAGRTTSGDAFFDPMLQSFDANGTLLGTNIHRTGKRQDQFYDLRRAGDGTYFAAGYLDEYGPCQQAYLAHLGSSATDAFRGQLPIGPCLSIAHPPTANAASAVLPLADGSVMVAGSQYVDATATVEAFLGRYTAPGGGAPVEAWRKFHGGPGAQTANAVEQLPDGGFLLVGATSALPWTADNEAFDVFVVRTNASGDVLWERAYGGAGNDIGSSVARMADGSYLITGRTTSSGAGSSDFYAFAIPAVCPP